MSEERARGILRDLRVFCSDHGIKLWACSCCGAVNVKDAVDGSTIVEMVEIGPGGFKGEVDKGGKFEYISEGSSG